MGAVRRRLLHEDAADRLRLAIVRGDLLPGQRLREPELARSLGLSRGPVREALRVLEQEGLVVISPHLGASVITLDSRSVKDALHLRRVVEELSSRSAIASTTRAEIAELQALVEAMRAAERSNQPDQIAQLDFQFHRRLVEMGQSDVAMRVWNTLAGSIRFHLAFASKRLLADHALVSVGHQDIVDALIARDLPRLAAVLSHHYAESEEALQQAQRAGQARTEPVLVTLEAY